MQETNTMQDVLIPISPEVKLGVRVQVQVTHFLSPTKFWVKIDDDSIQSEPLPDLHISPAHFYSVDIGTFCVAHLGNCIGAVRACVLDVVKDCGDLDTIAEVFCVDFGFTTLVGMDRLHPIPEDQAQVPCQAIPCCLRRLTATAKGLWEGWRPSRGAKFEAVFHCVSAVGTYHVDLLTVYETKDGALRVNVAEDLERKGQADMITYPFKARTDPIPSSMCDTQPISEQQTSSESNESSDVPPACIPAGSIVNIKVTYVLTPQHWYGQWLPLTDELNKLESLLYEYEDIPALPHEVNRGSHWVLREPRKSRGFRVAVERCPGVTTEMANVQVFYIDYGNRKTVPVNCLLRMKPAVVQFPAMASRYCLDSVQPVGRVWRKEALRDFEDLVYTEQPLTAQIVQKTCSDTVVLNVKLWNKTVDVEVGQALVSRGYAARHSMFPTRFVLAETRRESLEKDEVMWVDNEAWMEFDINTASNKVARGGLKRKVHLHLPPQLEMPGDGQKVLVQVSAACSPGAFYVILPYGVQNVDQLVGGVSEKGTCPNLRMLCNKLDEHYGRTTPDKLQSIFQDEIVAALERKRNCWHRARVTNIRGTTLEVLFVDFGFKRNVDLQDVRELTPEFLQLPFQAVKCHMHGLQPRCSPGAKMWSNQSHQAFVGLVSRQVLLCEVVKAFSELLQVRLFVLHQGRLQSVGDSLVIDGHAQYCLRTHTNAPLPAE
ncbi:tudor domain-containing protein 1-like [Ornithodoros turicata]|uniref:tudor domain-containing protein 1-like n=1 Tax=Ornithodoros turicata TaxID=34597 RepID=UPI00313A2FA2